ncbi:MAG: hypothetical protein QXU18_10340 [Thermoplasmatales archaeon]
MAENSVITPNGNVYSYSLDHEALIGHWKHYLGIVGIINEIKNSNIRARMVRLNSV